MVDRADEAARISCWLLGRCPDRESPDVEWVEERRVLDQAIGRVNRRYLAGIGPTTSSEGDPRPNGIVAEAIHDMSETMPSWRTIDWTQFREQISETKDGMR